METIDDTLKPQTEAFDLFYSSFNQAVLNQSITEYETGQVKTVANSLDELDAVIAE